MYNKVHNSQMWSIDYIAENLDEQPESIDTCADPVSSIDVEKEQPSTQVSEDLKSEEVTVESETKSEEIAACDREAAIKRVEELVKQMSLSQEQENAGNFT